MGFQQVFQPHSSTLAFVPGPQGLGGFEGTTRKYVGTHPEYSPIQVFLVMRGCLSSFFLGTKKYVVTPNRNGSSAHFERFMA